MELGKTCFFENTKEGFHSFLDWINQLVKELTIFSSLLLKVVRTLQDYLNNILGFAEVEKPEEGVLPTKCGKHTLRNISIVIIAFGGIRLLRHFTNARLEVATTIEGDLKNILLIIKKNMELYGINL